MKKLFPILAVIIFLISSCSSNPVKVACVGDSITEGYGIKIASKSSYPVVLDSILGDDYTVLNLGRSATNVEKKSDFPYWIAKEFSNVFAAYPNIIVIKLGTNDTKPWNWNAENFEKDYQAMIDTFKTIKSNPKIYLCKPVPVFESNWDADSPQRKWGINDSTVNAGVIPIIEKLATANNLEIIDLNTTMQSFSANFKDGIHPTEPAAAEMAKVVAKELMK